MCLYQWKIGNFYEYLKYIHPVVLIQNFTLLEYNFKEIMSQIM